MFKTCCKYEGIRAAATSAAAASICRGLDSDSVCVLAAGGETDLGQKLKNLLGLLSAAQEPYIGTFFWGMNFDLTGNK